MVKQIFQTFSFHKLNAHINIRFLSEIYSFLPDQIPNWNMNLLLNLMKILFFAFTLLNLFIMVVCVINWD